MELLTCPACGCSVQTADALLGRRVRCAACQHAFLATIDHSAAAERQPPPAPMEGSRRVPPRSRANGEYEGVFADEEQDPFCPGCGRRIGWRDAACPHCGEQLEPEDERRRNANRLRRDYEPHRGALILSLGNVSMFVGGLSLCTLGLGAVLSVPLGLLVWVMANHDLNRIRAGYMDPRGKGQTETGRIGALAGIVLGGIFAAFYALIYLTG